ncbi:acyl-CoA dehydrogenase [Natrialba hulunbeirensis JCM 10989]|uniref:Acyl-CoA dehydrogenase n=1 Tax=Natrialba hulunbeirensis JCM 10989 TaxID=1227493 RepID=M0A0I6_9EURY|nr:acyl-CoA dehydrogenase family protein [Natrialba hulunbeirensis]ELY92104.1 acyl-CoA dehydrogenase [Natrialba hulunbeirensis JCM 10989]
MTGHFELTEAHHEHREEVRQFCEAEIDPHVETHESEGTFPFEIVEKVGEAGFNGVQYGTEYNGLGLDYRSYAVTIEELARSWKFLAGTASICGSLVGYPIHEFGAEWQREEWLGSICAGDWIPALSLTEPDAGSDAAALETTAARDGDEYVIDGHKVWTTNGEVADFVVVAARTGDEDEGAGGVSLIGVPNPQERDGFEVVRDIPSMEGEAAIESEIKYDGLRVPVENVIGEEGRGFRYVMEGLDIGRIGTAAQGVGVAQAAFEASRDFADEREQFGQPIREFQGVSFKLADMATEVQASRLLTLQAAAKRDQGERVTQEAAMAKAKATDVAMDAATEAVQIHGSRGYSKDRPIERYMRVAKGMQIYEGTNEINRLVVANQLYE